jgi:hypothetical protein
VAQDAVLGDVPHVDQRPVCELEALQGIVGLCRLLRVHAGVLVVGPVVGVPALLLGELLHVLARQGEQLQFESDDDAEQRV